MKTHKWSAVKSELVKSGKLTQAQVDKNAREVAAELEAFNLRQLRDMAGITQAQMASRLKVVQSQMSRIEKISGEHRLSTLRKYVQALGGEVEIRAKIKGKTVELVV